MALPRCLTNKPFAKKGVTAQMQRPTGPAKACSCGHWEGGSANLLSRLQGVRVLCGRNIGYMYMFGIRVLMLKIPCQKGHNEFWVVLYYPNLSSKLWVPCQFQHFLTYCKVWLSCRLVSKLGVSNVEAPCQKGLHGCICCYYQWIPVEFQHWFPSIWFIFWQKKK